MDEDLSCMTEEEELALAMSASLASFQQESNSGIPPERKPDHYDYERNTEDVELAKVFQKSMNDKGKF